MRAQQGSCVKALRVLEAEGHITLPAPQCTLQITGPRLLESSVAAPVAVPDTVGAVEGLAIVLVTSRQDRAIWNTLMDREHPRAVTIFAGAQLRYLINSRHGILAAVGLSAAWYLNPRDLWMAWIPGSAKREAGRNSEPYTSGSDAPSPQ